MKTTDQIMSSNINTECSGDSRDDSLADSTQMYAVVLWCVVSECTSVLVCVRLITKHNLLTLTVPEWL